MKSLALLAAVIAAVAAVWYFAGVAEAPVSENGQTPLKIQRDNYPVRIEIYDGISASPNIKELDLSGKNLSGSLKAEIRMITQLEVLNLSQNNFTGLPAEVGQLSHLEVLDLSNNPLTGLPHEIGNLKQLKRLVLTGTNYSEFDLDIIKQGLSEDVVIVVD